MRMKLTEAAIEKLKAPPKGKQVDCFDAYMPGLILRINHGGAKVWRVRYYLKRTGKDGKQVSIPTTYRLCLYPLVSLKEAREKARQFDPHKAKTQAVTGSFKEVAERFLALHVKANKLRTGRDYERILNKLVYPHWQDRPFKDIRPSDGAVLLDTVAVTNGPRQADMVLAITSKLFNWYATRDEDYHAPIGRQ